MARSKLVRSIRLMLYIMDPIRWLENWYAAQCDGEWEHRFGVVIETLDNPGWRVRIELTGTRLEHERFDQMDRQAGELDWIHCSVQNRIFTAAGGPRSLVQICEVFRGWAESANAS